MIVVDCAAIVDALTVAPGTAELRRRLADEPLTAPSLLDYEVVSAVRGLTLAGHLSAARAEDTLSDFDELRIERWPSSTPLRRRAFQLRHHVSAYDAAYLVLAESLGCPMLTRDRRLLRAASQGVTVEVL